MLDWDRFCELVMNCFDKDQYQLLLKRFDALKQTGSVEDYHTDPFILGSDLQRRTTRFTEVKNRRCLPTGITNAIKVTRSMALIPIVTIPLRTGIESG